MSEIAALVADNLDIWTSAIQRKSTVGRGSSKKVNLYGIERLRALILDLAVRGKLVKQDAGDEPASILLQKFKLQRAAWVSEKRIRKGKPLEDISEDECRFNSPPSWWWTRFGHLGDWGAGATPNRKTSTYYDGQTPWFKSGELVADYISQSEETVTELALRECSLRLNAPGDVLIAMYGATIGKTSILEIEATTNQAVCACTPFDGMFNRFLLLLLKAMRPIFVGQGAGGAQPNISREKIIATPLCLPPLAEQKRIVAKVDELMALCDALERESEGAMAAHQALVKNLLATLTNSTNASDLSKNWARLEAHFDTLFTTDTSIDALKQTILDLAVRGKLVEQDEQDEPALLTLKSILSERESLVEAGQAKPIKKSKAAVDPFKLPVSWNWTSLGHLSSLITKGSSPKWQGVSYVEAETGLLFITSENVGNFALRKLDELKYVESRFREIEPRSQLKTGDILITLVGASIGRTALYDLEVEANINQAVALIRLVDEMLGPDKRYLLMFLNSVTAVDIMLGSRVITAQPNISLANVTNFPIPLPPLAEQKRIVTKVDALMALCDQLKSRLADAAQTQRHLADAISIKAAA